MRFFWILTFVFCAALAENMERIKSEFRSALKRADSNISTISSTIPTKEELERLRSEYKDLALVPEDAKKVIDAFEKERTKERFEQEFAQFLEFLRQNGSDYGDEEIKRFKKELTKALFPEKVPTFLYLFSTSMPPATVQNVFSSMERLKKRFPDIRFAGVVRGIELKGFGKKLARFVNFKNPEYEVKVHPLIFQKLGIDKVPAFVYAECPKRFRFKQCDFEYVAFGDFSLKFFLELLNDENSAKFGKYYEFFVEGE